MYEWISIQWAIKESILDDFLRPGLGGGGSASGADLIKFSTAVFALGGLLPSAGY